MSRPRWSNPTHDRLLEFAWDTLALLQEHDMGIWTPAALCGWPAMPLWLWRRVIRHGIAYDRLIGRSAGGER